jgi:Tol biopolymer transport system component
MIAFPENDAVEGWEWPEGATVSLTIDGAEGQEWSRTAHVTDWGDTRTYFRIDFGEDYDLLAGDVVTLTYGQTTRTHTVRNLSVTGVDPFADTVAGTADPGTALQVWPHGYDGPATLDLTAGDDGTWLADFNGVFELNSGTGGRSWILDESGSATAVDWQVDLAYDIYIFDTWTGSTRQLATTDFDEYNPTWSPNGKKIAHDGVSADGSHGIFVTDVRTGVTSPLGGAQDGGNDAAWSPNGRWIAFDRRWYGDPNVYLVPAEGGEALLAVEDAVAADWAPNGKRLVFERGDGSLATAPADGGKGAETSLGVNGITPAWSPDGSWIAYEFEGDIWKIAVNVQGRVLGEPVQLTSDALGDGHPTWSADGMTIVFASGVGDDFDLWGIPSGGGDRFWLTGAVEFGDYDPDYSLNGRYVAYASFSADGQAPRHWVAALTADAGTWTPGEHSFYFDVQYAAPEPGYWASEPKNFVVAEDVPLYDEKVSIRTLSMRDRTDDGCQVIDWALNPEQETLFQFGWVSDYALTYAEALAHFASLTATAHWDGEFSTDFTVHEVIPWTDGLDWDQYSCSFTP